MKKLIFDTTDVNTIADSDSVGAYLRSSDGTLLTHTDVGGKMALDVRVAEGINVEVDLDHADDSVKIGDGTDFLEINGDGSINAVVTATQLDIDDLNATDDAIQAWTFDGTGNAISSTAGALDVNVTNSVSVNDAALANTAIANAANSLSVANTAQDLVSSPLTNRKYLYAYNNDNRTAYIGSTGVSAANGFPIPPAAMIELRAGASIDIEWVSAKTSHDMRTLEIS